MKKDPQDEFSRMDAMIARIFSDITREMVSGMPLRPAGYRIVIRGSGVLPGGEPHGREIQPRDPRAPAPEVHRIGDEVKVVAELPGADEGSIRLGMPGSTLTIDAGGNGLQYHTDAELPPVEAASMQTSFKNGVLEVTFIARSVADTSHAGKT
jgi:HSP20 family molecular chaperone IbpA